MKVYKVINNNVILTYIGGQEVLAMGKGVGFDVQRGDEVFENRVEKIYKLESSEVVQKIANILQRESVAYLEAAEQIIQFVQQELRRTLDEIIYVLLTDHFAFYAHRREQQLFFQNPLLREIEVLYNPEYEVSLKALKILEERFGWEITTSEAGFLALHIVSASGVSDMYYTMNTTQLVHDLLHDISTYFDVAYDEQELNYLRLITHLQFFAQRVLKKIECLDPEDELTRLVIHTYPNIAAFTSQVAQRMREQYQYQMNLKEHAYLILHIQRVLFSQ